MTKSNRVTNVQVPGAAPAAQPGPAADTDIATTSTVAADPAIVPAGAAPAAQGPAVDLAPTLDIDALRAQIRDEERQNARLELGAQIEAAASVVRTPAAGAPQRSRADYRNMRAHEIDPASLTAPVMTLDGYLCPPAPEAKK
jgi:hypothetical protein